MTIVPQPVFAAGMIGGWELVIILVIVLVLFGGSKLPGLAKGMGQAIKEFKNAQKDDEPAAPKPAPAAEKQADTTTHKVG